MTVVQINNISVEFPFEPYDGQKKYMAKIIESLQKGQHAILESPAGTGKTLSLLCATLAWLKQNDKEKPMGSFQKTKSFCDFTQRTPGESLRKTKSFDLDERQKTKVIYATRTHSQIGQAIKELKKTAYNNFKATVIASRDRLCIHPKLDGKTNTDKMLMCKSMMKKSENGEIRSKCKYYNYNRRFLEQIPTITDIEDLGSIGMKHECCPYFLAKAKSAGSDIVFIPYGYLIDPIIRKANDIDLNRSIIILDEAHNVNHVCEDSASTAIKDTEITAAIRDLNTLINPDEKLYCSGSSGKEERLKKSLENLRQRLQSMQSHTSNGGHLFHLLRCVDITQEDASSTIELLESLITRILERRFNQEAENGTKQNGAANARRANKSDPSGSGLKALLKFLQTIFSSPEAKWNSSYRMHIQKNPTAPETILHFWCFDPAIRMKSLLDHDIRGLILTSSTLAPFDTFIAELGVQFPIRFISDHVIERNQKFAKILMRGFGDLLLDSRNRSNVSYLSSIGQSIREISQRVPGGLLVFFPSYAFMEKCMSFWGKENNERIWNEISQQTTICIEIRDKKHFKLEMGNYCKAIREKKKAIFLAVARGKMSEGLDFSDMYGRAVMMVGIPFAPDKDPKIVQKRLYLDAERIQRPNLPSGDDWYISDAIRTANQAMGRVIRHKHDYGAMLLCDTKFNDAVNKKWISEWIGLDNNQHHAHEFNDIVEDLSLFYTNAEQELPMLEPQVNPESFILHDDDEWFSTTQTPEEHSDKPSNDEASNAESVEETLDFSSLESDFNEVPNERFSTQMEESENTQNRKSSSRLFDRNSSANFHTSNVTQPDDSDRESAVQPKRSKLSSKNTVETEVEFTLLKAALQGDKYEKLEEIVSKYNTDSMYESLRDGLFGIFDEPKLWYSLKGCVILFKREHKTDFNKDCQQFINANKLKSSIREFFKTQQ